jgi:hypothetical protein
MNRCIIRKLPAGRDLGPIHTLERYHTGTLEDCNILLSCLTFFEDRAIFGGGYWIDSEGNRYFLT